MAPSRAVGALRSDTRSSLTGGTVGEDLGHAVSLTFQPHESEPEIDDCIANEVVGGLVADVDMQQPSVDSHDDSAYDVVRDTVVRAGLGLIRMERRRHRMAEIFATAESAR